MVLLLFPVLFFSSIIFLIVSNFSRKPFFTKVRFFCGSLFVGLLITFLVSLAEIYRNPYWIDGRTEVKMIFPEHLFAATLAASYTWFFIVPSFVALLHLFRHYFWESRHQEKFP
ncbi:MAG: hypothetical protein WAS33_13020 [Candidatus Promineifilaceae bacterium]